MNSVSENRRIGALEEYARLKLELSSIVRMILHASERRKDELAIRNSRRLLARLAEDRFHLAVVGQFSRGKSSLMNALLGAPKLPTGVLPLTSVITTVTYGESETVLLKREGRGLPLEIQLDQLAEYVTQQGNPANEKGITIAEVHLPNEILRLGVHFVDTPGVASVIAANTRTTRDFLPEVDAAILVTSFESPMTEAEVGFLREVRAHVRKVFVTVNKLDLVPPGERGPALASVRDLIRASLEDARIPVFAVSARDALRAKMEASPDELARSGLPDLETALTDFLRREKARELLSRAADRAAAVLEDQELAIRISQHALGPEARRLEERLAERISDLTEDRTALMARMRGRLSSEFPLLCESCTGLWTPEDEVRLTSELRERLSGGEFELAGTSFEKLLQEAFDGRFSAWLARSRDQIEHSFLELAREHLTAVDSLTAEVWLTPAAVLGNEAGRSGTPPSSSTGTEPPVFRTIRVPLANSFVPWWFDILPPGRLRRLMARRWLRRIPELRSHYQQAVSASLVRSADDWVDRLDRELGDEIERTRRHVSALLNAQPETSELSEVESLLARLREFSKSLLSMGTGEAHDGPLMAVADAPTQRPASTPECPVCARILRALFDFMSHYQYALSEDADEQRRHAMLSGFCPLHTWQFEAISSPQGICSAYPPLLTLLAERLYLLAEDEISLSEVESGVRSLLPCESRCPACRVTAGAEKSAARAIARQVGEDIASAAGVCTLHLCSILAAGPDPAAARPLLLAQARAFEALAEDMQNYVLKQEATRHHLWTNAERRAAWYGLMRLVGHRNTVAPWRTG